MKRPDETQTEFALRMVREEERARVIKEVVAIVEHAQGDVMDLHHYPDDMWDAREDMAEQITERVKALA